MTSFGEFDQCLETVVPHPKQKDDILFQGQYCLVDIRFRVPPKKRRYNFNDHVIELENFTGSKKSVSNQTVSYRLHDSPLSARASTLCVSLARRCFGLDHYNFSIDQRS
ncbi:uncharacterized protein NPIL_73341 [Nephila pilipes]|uniref:Uncharacterized protein n=1 Tax=Nephila pilipes TaxID=299642 RepID=A0A8X6QB13_NEPPI|nr:uncharacterized protein NPIL_73341 [Nephila pilipes]